MQHVRRINRNILWAIVGGLSALVFYVVTLTILSPVQVLSCGVILAAAFWAFTKEHP